MKTKKKIKRPGFWLSIGGLRQEGACGYGLQAARRALKGRKRVFVTPEMVEASRSGHAWWLAVHYKLTAVAASYRGEDGGVGRNIYARGQHRGYRRPDGSGYVYLRGVDRVAFDVGEMPETYDAIVRAARQRLRASRDGGGTSDQPAFG